jgi:glycine oxidase
MTPPMGTRDITVLGAGITGLWQALTLAGRGHRVRLLDRAPIPFADGASRWAAAMLAPDCEAEGAESIVRDLGHESLAMWRAALPALITNAGSLVVAAARDRVELTRFARMTQGHRLLDAAALRTLDPALAARFSSALFFADEAHVETPRALAALLDLVRGAGVEVRFGADAVSENDGATTIDCRGLAASDRLPNLRGVRGERLLVRAPDVALARPVRLLHPRHPLYVVPWSDQRYIVGATVIESDDAGPPTVRSALELLGLAYALDPAFAEAEIIEIGVGVRPAFPDNVPGIVVTRERIHANGLYRHGFLTAPALARRVADYLETGARDQVFRDP